MRLSGWCRGWMKSSYAIVRRTSLNLTDGQLTHLDPQPGNAELAYEQWYPVLRVTVTVHGYYGTFASRPHHSPSASYFPELVILELDSVSAGARDYREASHVLVGSDVWCFERSVG